MKIFVFTLILAIALASHHDLQSYDQPSHEGFFMNDACCREYGGVPCGVYSRTCCLGRCSNFGIAQMCQGQNLQLRSSMCSNSCSTQCRMNGGIICGTNFFTNSCCQPQFCQGLTSLTRSCLPGTAIPLRNCYSKALLS